MEIYALGLLILIGLIGVVVRVSKGSGYKEAELDAGDLYIRELQQKAKEAKDNEEATANLTRDMLRQRLQE